MPAPTVPPAHSEILATYLRGQYLTAYRYGLALGLWNAPESSGDKLFAARVLRAVGAERLARLLILQAWRRDRESELARFWFAQEIRSPVRCLLFMDEQKEPTDPAIVTDWWLLRALQLAIVRDFRMAHDCWNRAQQVSETPWLWTIKSFIRREESRYREAMDCLDQALKVRNWYSPAVRSKARLHRTLGEDDQALALLQAAGSEIETYEIPIMEAAILQDRDDHSGALEAIEQVPRLAPRMEASLAGWLAYRTSYLSALVGSRERALTIAASKLTPALEQLRDQLTRPPGERKKLVVPRLAQRHNTCAPACLAAMARYWGSDIEQNEIVEKICRDGTSAYSERKWANDRGWVTRDFRMDWQTTVSLIDRGIPFAFITTGVATAHMQIAVGYDSGLGAVLVQDPSSPSILEQQWSDLEAEEEALGSRAFLMLPAQEAGQLSDLVLPDSSLYDNLYMVGDSLESHDRVAAKKSLETLERLAPDHIVVLKARRALATYDNDPRALLDWATAMLDRYPKNQSFRLEKLRGMENLASASDRIELAERFLGEARTPELMAELANLLIESPNATRKATQVLWHVLETRPTWPSSYHTLANALWTENRQTATILYRLASCLEEHLEAHAWSYFLASRHLGREAEALSFLEERAARLGAFDANPIITLADAYELLYRHESAEGLLSRAEQDHSEDGGFLLRLADHYLTTGRAERAGEVLKRAEGKCPASRLDARLAQLATAQGDTEEAARLWEKVAEYNPLNIEAQRHVANYRSTSQGAGSAIEKLRDLAAQYPFHESLAQLLYERLEQDDRASAFEYLAAYSTRVPGDAWAQRELALLEAKSGRKDESLQRIERLLQQGDRSAASYAVKGEIHSRRGEGTLAAECHEMALDRDVDLVSSFRSLLTLAPTREDKVAVLERQFGRIVHQPIVESAIGEFFELADGLIAADEVESKVEALTEARPGLWHAWLALVNHDLARGNTERALRRAHDLADRFPFVACSWRTLGRAHLAGGEIPQAIAAFEQSVALAPGWSPAWRDLAVARRQAGEPDVAIELLKRAVRVDPQEAANFGYLADEYWLLDDKERAVGALKTALELSVGYRWAWARLCEWSSEPETVVEFARGLAQMKGTSCELWLSLASILEHAPVSKQLECANEAIAAEPTSIEAHDLRAQLLAELGQYEEALEACRPQFWGDSPPVPLRGRRAWILHLRGEKQQAMEGLLAAVASASNYDWGIERLLEWARESDDADSFLAAARRIVEVAPHSARAHAELGDLLRLRKDFAPADQALQRALAIAPRDVFTLLTVVDLRLDEGRIDDAERSLELVDQNLVGAIYRRVRIAAERRNLKEAMDGFDDLLKHDQATTGVALELHRELGDHRAVQEALETSIERHIENGTASRLMGLLWWETRGGRLVWFKAWPFLMWKSRPSEGWICAVQNYIEGLADRQKRVTFAFFKWLFRRRLRSSTPLWASVGFVLVRWGLFQAARHWMRDLRKRDDLEGWMLWNASLTQRSLGSMESAADFHRRALALPDDDLTHKHKVQLALYESIEGDRAYAESLLADARGKPLGPIVEFSRSCAEAILEWRRSPQDEASHEKLGSALVTASWRVPLRAHTADKAQLKWVLKRVRQIQGGARGWRWWLKYAKAANG